MSRLNQVSSFSSVLITGFTVLSYKHEIISLLYAFISNDITYDTCALSISHHVSHTG